MEQVAEHGNILDWQWIRGLDYGQTRFKFKTRMMMKIGMRMTMIVWAEVCIC